MYGLRNLRLLILFGVLILAIVYTVHQFIYSRAWNSPLQVVIYPINGDGTEHTQHYIDTLTEAHFNDIDQFMAREAKRYQLLLVHPTKTRLGPQVSQPPPKLPEDAGPFTSLLWGLKTRWWAYKVTPENDDGWDTVRMYVAYHSGQRLGALDHSLGLQKGLMGIVNAFALVSQNKQNNIVIAHELLHTVGATDKYNTTLAPIYPEGYANPHRKPLYPQRSAEIMAGRIPTSEYASYMAHSLKSVIIGPKTAKEINWLKD